MSDSKDKILGFLTQAPKKLWELSKKHGEKLFLRIGISILAGYVAATVVSSWAVSQFEFKPRKGPKIVVRGGFQLSGDRVNYVKLRRGILGNNVFHPEREVPDESVADKEEEQTSSGDFDIEAPCVDSRLKHSLIGTIALGPNSIAILKEPGIQDSDSYKIGDEIIGFEGVDLVAVERKRIILNNNGRKECLVIKEKEIENLEGFEEPSAVSSLPQKGDGSVDAGSSSGIVVLEGAWVVEQLGEGFGDIISAARLVPNMVDGAKIDGFKIYKIVKDKIFGKIGFKEKDIITRVNDVSLTEPEQGFAVYEALEEEREITFYVSRKGNPVSIRVQIK